MPDRRSRGRKHRAQRQDLEDDRRHQQQRESRDRGHHRRGSLGRRRPLGPPDRRQGRLRGLRAAQAQAAGRGGHPAPRHADDRGDRRGECRPRRADDPHQSRRLHPRQQAQRDPALEPDRLRLRQARVAVPHRLDFSGRRPDPDGRLGAALKEYAAAPQAAATRKARLGHVPTHPSPRIGFRQGRLSFGEAGPLAFGCS
ncbi:hypothetical protein BOSEA31B_14508 [Hyphomicrobiales bacterium]|nr:hypothetical protein BOSEA31B_14508 [Hyphomicrobiales bacterium]